MTFYMNEVDPGVGGDDRRVVVEPDPDEHLGTVVAVALGDAMGVPVTELDVELNDYVDPDALDRVFSPCVDGSPRTGGQIVFSVSGYRVTIDGDRRVAVQPE